MGQKKAGAHAEIQVSPLLSSLRYLELPESYGQFLWAPKVKRVVILEAAEKRFCRRGGSSGVFMGSASGEATLLCLEPSSTMSGVSFVIHSERSSQDGSGLLRPGRYGIIVVA